MQRKLRIVKNTPPVIGVCERCNAQFKSDRPEPLDDIREQYRLHACKPLDSNQKALRIVRDGMET